MSTATKPIQRACGNPACFVSTGIHEHDDGVSSGYPGVWAGLTFGSGELDECGYWSRPCPTCARDHERRHPEHGPCWPFTEEQLETLFPD